MQYLCVFVCVLCLICSVCICGTCTWVWDISVWKLEQDSGCECLPFPPSALLLSDRVCPWTGSSLSQLCDSASFLSSAGVTSIHRHGHSQTWAFTDTGAHRQRRSETRALTDTGTHRHGHSQTWALINMGTHKHGHSQAFLLGAGDPTQDRMLA